MSRAISRTYSILLFSLLLFGGRTFAKPQDSTANVELKSLTNRISCAKLIQLLGEHSLSDSSFETDNGQQYKMLLFEPVPFEGVHSLVEAFITHDSTAKIEIYLPYIGRPETRLKFPFELGDFVQSTQEDYDQMERKIEDELGIPTILTGTNFEYLTPGNTQSIFGVFENGETTITIVPSSNK